MPPKSPINVYSLTTKKVRVEGAGAFPTPTADWAVKMSDLHVISTGEKAVKVELAAPVNLRVVNQALRGRREIGASRTSPTENLESA